MFRKLFEMLFGSRSNNTTPFQQQGSVNTGYNTGDAPLTAPSPDPFSPIYNTQPLLPETNDDSNESDVTNDTTGSGDSYDGYDGSDNSDSSGGDGGGGWD